MGEAEAREDAEFAIVYHTARGDMDFEQMARVLSARLRQMDKRAKAANRRADDADKRCALMRVRAEGAEQKLAARRATPTTEDKGRTDRA